MKTLLGSLLALGAVLSLAACADDGRPCPPGYHLGYWGHSCHPNR